jgi:hypothetical protein
MLKTPTIDAREIHPLTDFLRNSKAHIAHLKETGGPEVLTVNGKAEVIVQDAASYQQMLERLERADLVASLREALQQLKDGQGTSFEALEAELNQRYGV